MPGVDEDCTTHHICECQAAEMKRLATRAEQYEKAYTLLRDQIERLVPWVHWEFRELVQNTLDVAEEMLHEIE